MWQLFLDLLFPRRSLSGAEGEWITEQERRKLVPHPVIEEIAELRRRGIRSLDRLVAASTYVDSPLLKKAIHTFKYGHVRWLDKELGRLIVQALTEIDHSFQITKNNHGETLGGSDGTRRWSRTFEGRVGSREGNRRLPSREIVLCPVPLHWIRLFQRGFNQSELLAHVVARERGLTVLPLLKRTRWTGSQMKRHRADRLTALDRAFHCTVDHAPRHVVLIDDLSTTGTTLAECAKALKQAGAEYVEGWVIAHDKSWSK
jgi:ComF family protein